MASRYDRVLAKYDWAKKHVDKFEVASQDFRLANPHAIGRMDNIETGQVTFYVDHIPVVPDELAMMLGDALHILRSTLDHLAWALVLAAQGTPDKYTSFPIFDSAKDYVALSRGRVPGLREYCYEVLDRIQPYQGGWSHCLWQLHKLDIVNKHRLFLTVCTKPVGRTMTPSEKAAFNARKTIIGPKGFAMRQYTVAASKPSNVPLQAGDELATLPASDVDENMGFSFDVAINEPEIVEGISPTFLLLRFISSEVLATIDKLALCL